MAEAGVVWVPVVPSMRGFATTLTAGATKGAAKAGTAAGTTLGASMRKAFAAAGGGIAGTMKAASVGAVTVGATLNKRVTLPLVAVGVAAARVSADFEKSMNNLQAISGATGKDLKTLRDQAIDLGAKTKFSAQEAADGMAVLAQAGFSTKEIYKAIPGVLNLAAAGNMSIADSADIASAVLRGYQMQVSQLAKVNDVLAKASIATNAELSDLGEAFKYVGPIAKSAGLSFTETTAAIGLLSNAGIKGSQAGTSLRMAIGRLLAPTKKVQGILDDLGISATTSGGKLRPLDDIIRQLRKSGATTGQMMQIFGRESGPAMSVLVGQGEKALTKLDKQLQRSGGTADKVAKTQMKGLRGQLDNLQSAAESLLIAIGDTGVLGGLTKLTTSLTDLVTKASEANPRMLKFGVYAGIAAAALGPLVWTGGKVISTVTGVVNGIRTVGGATVSAVRGTSQMVAGFRNMDLAFKSGATGATTFGAASRAAANSTGRFVKSLALSTAGLVRNGAAAVANAARFIAMKTAQLAVAVATRAWAAAQWLINAAMTANPIGIVIAVIVALVAAIVIAYKKSSTFRAIVQAAFRGIATVAQWVWQNVLSPVFSALGIVVKAVVALVQVQFGLMQIAFKIAGRIAMWLYRNAVQPAMRGIASLARWLYKTVIQPVMALIGAALRAVGRVFSWLWRNAVVPAWRGIGLIVRVQAAVLRSIFAGIRAAIRVLGNAATWLYRNAIAPAFRAIRTVVSTVWNSGVRPVLSAMSNFIRKTVPNAFRSGVSAVSAAWNKVKAVAKAPVSFVLRTVIKKGIVDNFNKIAGMFGVKKVDYQVPKGFARGTGNLTSAADVGWTNRPTAIVGEGSRRHPEVVIPTDPRYRSRALGLWEQAGYQLLAKGGTVGSLIAFGKMLRRKGFRVSEGPDGFGPVHQVHSAGSYHYKGQAIDVNYGPGGQSAREMAAFDQLIKSGIARKQYGLRSIWRYPGHYNHAHFDLGGGADLGMAQGGGKISGWLKGLLGGVAALNPFKGLLDKLKSGLSKYAQFGGLVKGMGSKLISGAIQWVKDHNPFAGIGEGNTDTGGGARRWTGLVRRVLKELGAPASALGPVLHRINQESGGNPNAVNNWDSNARAGHPSQGLMQTIPGTFAAYAGPYRKLGIRNPLANIYAGVNYAMHRYGRGWIARMTAPGGYDSGGWLNPGMQLAVNATRKPEAVLTDKQWAAMSKAASFGGAGTTVHVNLRSTDMTPAAIEHAMHVSARRARIGRPS